MDNSPASIARVEEARAEQAEREAAAKRAAQARGREQVSAGTRAHDAMVQREKDVARAAIKRYREEFLARIAADTFPPERLSVVRLKQSFFKRPKTIVLDLGHIHIWYGSSNVYVTLDGSFWYDSGDPVDRDALDEFELKVLASNLRDALNQA